MSAPPPTVPTLRLGISSCLLGEEVRYDGGHKNDAFVRGLLEPFVAWIPVCPEVEVGMGVPREAVHLEGELSAPRMVGSRSGTDWSQAMRRWARRRVEELSAADLDGYLLKRGSPSCGLHRVKVFVGGMPRPEGRGLFAAELARALPLLPLEEEGRLRDPALRERFVAAAFAHRRFKDALAADPTPGGLVAFHTGYKLTIMAHSPEHYRAMGRLVADSGTLPWGELTGSYARLLAEALAVPARRGRHVNTLQHLAGFLKRRLSAADKEELGTVIESYRRGQVPLVVPLTLLRHHFRHAETPAWVHRQIYLDPYPAELMLRNEI
ncbi:MAG: DUF523 and DUF1722 domain-containing protein [Thermoanaerobaculia bacterium]